jgi:nitroreductase
MTPAADGGTGAAHGGRSGLVPAGADDGGAGFARRTQFLEVPQSRQGLPCLLLDAGHLSQTFYLLATEAGMPAFVTAAVNEIDIERALGLDPLKDMVIAVCGCGPASGAQNTVELRYEP